MLIKIFFIICVLKLVNAQSSGQFWWLHDEVKKLRDVDVEPAKFEELNEFDNDENDKVTFNNDLEDVDTFGSARTGKNSKILELNFPGPDGFVWPQSFSEKVDTKLNDTRLNKTENVKDIVYTTEASSDEFQLKFPDDGILWRDATTTNTDPPTQPEPNSVNEDKIHFTPHKENNNINYENICSYMEKNLCERLDGLVYQQNKRSIILDVKYADTLSVCCIFPIKPKRRSPVVFRDAQEKKIRFTRSTAKIGDGLNQRKVLLRRRATQYQTYNPTTPPYVTKRIVTVDDEEDPYANIKNGDYNPGASFINRPYPTRYGNQDYEDEYTEELPRPGLTGLYSDVGTIPGSWTFVNDDSVGDEYDDVGYGVPTTDPRVDRLGTTKPIKNKLPPQITSTSEETDYRAGSETIRYQSNPDFKVLQGFKLLNLVRNRSRVHTRNSRRSTASVSDDGEAIAEHFGAGGDYSDYDFSDVDREVYKGCGKSNERSLSEDRSNPWLLLVVRSRRSKTVLCHATLVHPRAAVTAAICVHKAPSGEVTVRAGLWSINEDSSKSQHRVAAVHEHPRYSQAEIAHDLAVLYWNRPLRVTATVQPACLAAPKIGDSCAFVGWGGQDQTILTRPLWQSATVTSQRECISCLHKKGTKGTNLPKDAFCASVETPGCVTGVGGTLMCDRNGRRAAVGLMVWRESCDVTSPIIMLPAQEWIKRALLGLGII